MNIQKHLYQWSNHKSVLPLIALLLSIGASPTLHAEIYKCVNSQGYASFSSIPCQDKSSPPTETITAVTDAKPDPASMTYSGNSSESNNRQLLFAVDGKIRALQKKIDKLQRQRAKEVAAADLPEATHNSVYRQQIVIRTKFDTLIASDLDTISQLRKKRQTLLQKVL